MSTTLHKKFTPNTKKLPELDRYMAIEFMKEMAPWEDIKLDIPNKNKIEKEIENVIGNTRTVIGHIPEKDFPQRKLINVEAYTWDTNPISTESQINKMKELSNCLINSINSNQIMCNITVIKHEDVFYYYNGFISTRLIPNTDVEFNKLLAKDFFPAYHNTDSKNTNAQSWFKHQARSIMKDKIKDHLLHVFEYHIFYEPTSNSIEIENTISYG